MTVTSELFLAEKHYKDVCSWWAAHDWAPIPVSHLPDIGFVVSVDDQPAAAGWIYQTDSAFCLFEWIVANPAVRREPRALALSYLIEKVKEAASAMGFQTIFMSVRSQPLISRLKKHGFADGDENMTNMTFSVQGGT